MTVLFRIATAFALTLGAGCTFAATIVVNSSGEGGDYYLGDGVAEIEPGTGIVTLFSAIEEANAFPGPDTIMIGIPTNYYCNPLAVEPDTPRLAYSRPLPPP